jgi:putative oxidoreductase
MNLALLVLHVVVGVLFFAHGAQKLFGWFGGYGIGGTAGFFDQIGLRPGRMHAWAAALAETVGGILLALGLFTPIGAALVIAVMTAAVITVHWEKGPFNTEGGYEFNLTLIAALAALVDGGPGSPSVDRALGIDETGPAWALAAIAGGAAGSTLAVEAGKRLAQKESSGSGRFAREHSPDAETVSTSG